MTLSADSPQAFCQARKQNFSTLPKSVQIYALKSIQLIALPQSDVEKVGQKVFAELVPLLKKVNSPFQNQVDAISAAVNCFPSQSIDHLRYLMQNTKHKKIRIGLIRLLSLLRNEQDIDAIIPFLESECPDVRAAAFDALGIIHNPPFHFYSIRNPIAYQESLLNFPLVQPNRFRSVASPPLRYMQASNRFGSPPPNRFGHPLQQTPPHIQIPHTVFLKAKHALIHGENRNEREAAARFLLSWKPVNYKFRFAEWGVWIADGKNVTLVQSVLDEIPDFVHKTGSSIDRYTNTVNQAMIVTKPIIHLTTDTPLAVDIQVMFYKGRPWFAYPIPNNVETHARGQNFNNQNWRFIGGGLRRPSTLNTNPTLKNLDPKPEKVFEGRNIGYPWIMQYKNVNPFGVVATFPNSHLESLGLRWFHLIVSPKKMPWMKVPEVEEKFQWWSDLRKVPSSWITSENETERFLYYDGPTNLEAPFVIKLNEDQLEISANENFQWFQNKYNPNRPGNKIIEFPITVDQKAEFVSSGFYVDVQNGNPVASLVKFSRLGGTVKVDQLKRRFEGKKAEQKFLEVLVKKGLTKEEATGLFESWRKQFFQTEGRRFLMFLSRKEYDTFCPIGVRPAPTESARVGIILTEFDQKVVPLRKKTKNEIKKQPRARIDINSISAGKN